jgi:hypothetical protein
MKKAPAAMEHGGPLGTLADGAAALAAESR